MLQRWWIIFEEGEREARHRMKETTMIKRYNELDDQVFGLTIMKQWNCSETNCCCCFVFRLVQRHTSYIYIYIYSYHNDVSSNSRWPNIVRCKDLVRFLYPNAVTVDSHSFWPALCVILWWSFDCTKCLKDSESVWKWWRRESNTNSPTYPVCHYTDLPMLLLRKI
jgi:hypothetical protein